MNILIARSSHTQSTGALRLGFVLSGIAHIGVVAAAMVWAARSEPARPPVYRVELLGAPPGVRRAGVVTPKASETPSAAEAPAGAERAPVEKTVATKKTTAATPRATPSAVRSKAAGAKSTAAPAKAAPPKAGSGKDGGKGADVRNVRTDGIDFPYPGYVSNILRQISLAYSPSRGASASLVTEVKFMIRRDGSVAGIEIVKSSGNRLFDIEARGTIEAVGSARSFGPLPSGWPDDVLIVYFTFDYALLP